MKASQVNSTLETLTNIAVLLAAIAVLSALSWGYFLQRRPTSLQSGLQRGHTLQNILGVDFSNSHKTLLIAMSTKCPFCTESISFYNQLAELQQKTGQSTRIVAIFPEGKIAVEQYVQQNKINGGIITVAEANLQSVNVNSTPTMVLLDNSGKIIDFWIGKVPEDVQQKLLKHFSGSQYS